MSVKVLIAGSSGFIGARLAQAFSAAGHDVICAQRSERLPAGCARRVALDYTAPPPRAELVRQLAGIDVVINAVGILRERGRQTFDALHVAGPRALFDACVDAGVPRVLQISALGADESAVSAYHRSKYAADSHLRSLPLGWTIVQPSLVYGEGGTSARLFELLATLPMIVVPGRGDQRVQPVHVEDFVEGVLRLAQSEMALRNTIVAVGPQPLTLADFLCGLRAALRLPRTRVVRVPVTLVRWAARLGDHVPLALLDSDTLGMLERGNVGDPGPWQRCLGRAALPVARFGGPARPLPAPVRGLLPALRGSIAMMWLFAGFVSLGIYPVRRSLSLLEDVGAPTMMAPLLLYGAACLDLLLGVLTLLPRRPRWIWSAQIVTVLLYTAIITWRLPQLWLDPFGPIVKNVPILVLLVFLRRLENGR